MGGATGLRYRDCLLVAETIDVDWRWVFDLFQALEFTHLGWMQERSDDKRRRDKQERETKAASSKERGR